MTSDQVLQILEHYQLLEASSVGLDLVQIMCPFHSSETKPSCCVYVTQGSFYCFGCDAKGSMIDFVGRIENVDDLRALLMVRKMVGDPSKRELRESRRPSAKQALTSAKIYFTTLPRPDWRAVGENYLTGRGFTVETLKAFDVRINVASTHMFIIPIREDNKFKGYVGRRIGSEEPRYLYNAGFLRRSTLSMNGSLAMGPVLVVEGTLDMMKAWQHGYKNVVCLLGWKASQYHLDRIAEIATRVVCGLDNDPAGEKGYEWLVKSLGNDMEVSRLKFPKGVKDVGEMTKLQFWRSVDGSKTRR